MKNYTIEQVIVALRKKNITITLEEPIIKKESSFESIRIEEVNKKASEKGLTREQTALLALQGKLLETLEITPKRILTEVIVQDPYTVNISTGHDMGNKTWGKIDFLVNFNGFKLVNNFLDNTEKLNTIKIEDNGTKDTRKKQKEIHPQLQISDKKTRNRKVLV